MSLIIKMSAYNLIYSLNFKLSFLFLSIPSTCSIHLLFTPPSFLVQNADSNAIFTFFSFLVQKTHSSPPQGLLLSFYIVDKQPNQHINSVSIRPNILGVDNCMVPLCSYGLMEQYNGNNNWYPVMISQFVFLTRMVGCFFVLLFI